MPHQDNRTTSSAIPDGLVTALVISPPGNALHDWVAKMPVSPAVFMRVYWYT